MASAVVMDNVSDEEWLVMRSRACIKSDPFAAKAWMITARTLFPGNFTIQFESYTLEKVGKNIKEAAKLLEEMFQAFPQETKLWAEVQCILEVLQTDSADNKNSFLTEIFAAVSTHVQCQMLLCVAEKIIDKLEQCRLMLLAMRKFPNLVSEHGLKLIESLLNAERHAQVQSPVNCYRKILVCDVLPLVLQRCKHVEVSTKHVCKWLLKSVEFYVSYVTQPPSQDATPMSPDILSPTKKSLKRAVSIAGLQDKDKQIHDPWGSLFTLMSLLGQHLKWDMEIDFFSKSRDYQWQYILSLYNRSSQPGADNHLKQILYVATILFLECLYSYVSNVDSDMFATGGVASLPAPLVLIETFKLEVDQETEQPVAKKSRSEMTIPDVHAAPCVPRGQEVVQNFLTALKCYELLHSSQDLQREFINLGQNWRMVTWTWMSLFQTDMYMYQGAFQEAVANLQNYVMGSKGRLQIRSAIQLACCFFCLGNYSKACELVLDVMSTLPENGASVDTTEPKKESLTREGSGRQLLLTMCSESEILPYCIQLLLSCFKEKAYTKMDDEALGNLIVLLQFNWPKQEAVFTEVVQKIQNQGTFTYNLFFNYVINILFVISHNILEEFSFLKFQEVNLDILPISTKVLSQQRTMTRGVNKGVKQDFKQMMAKQVGRCEESVEKLIREFLNEEREGLLKILH
ncbi:hypothetical protein ScPMuIL_002746 [Solemya velum]